MTGRTRRASMAPIISKTTTVTTKTTTSFPSRRLSIATASSAAKMTSKVKPQKDEFVSGDLFQFGEFSSPKGVVTRSRRSSMGGASSLTKPTAPVRAKKSALPTLQETTSKVAKKTVGRTKKTVVEKTKPAPKSVANRRQTLAPKVTKKMVTVKAPATPPVSKKVTVVTHDVSTPAKLSKAVSESLFGDVEIVLDRLENTPIGKRLDANGVFARLEQVYKSPDRVDIVVEKLSKITPPPGNRKIPAAGLNFSPRVTRSVRKVKKTPAANRKGKILAGHRFGPASDKSSPKTTGSMPPATFYGTPQSMDPMALLKKSMKNKVQEEIKERVAKMPSTSPYTILEGETENGSPEVMLTKLGGNNKSRATLGTKYLTATPGVSSAKRRCVLGSVDTNTMSSEVTFTPASAKRRLNLTASPMSENDLSNSSWVMGSPSPVKQKPQLVTGDLARACAIM